MWIEVDEVAAGVSPAVEGGILPPGNSVWVSIQVPPGKMPNATRISMQTETRSQSPGGSYDNSPTFQGWVRSTEDPTSPERDGRLQLQGISVRIDVGYSCIQSSRWDSMQP
jgi:hypothetical protein